MNPSTYTIALTLLLVAVPGFLVAEESVAPPEPKVNVEEAGKPKQLFIRVSRDDNDKPVAMETAIVRFKPKKGAAGPDYVDLVGAVHVGDGSYYQQLNQEFKNYDAVLYELVAPEGTRIPKDGRKGGGSAIGSVQQSMKSILELEYQLEKIDYTKKNFIHADMSPDEFADSMEDRDESFNKMFWRMIGQGLAQQERGKGTSDVAMLFAFFSKDRAMRLKRIVAQQFEDLEGQMQAINGPDGSTIITERNKKCFEVLTREIKAGKKQIAVFYGAGHLADMEERLTSEFQMERDETRWLKAWKLTK